jgi:transcription initiation factor TFIIIB Brf1 subunit/transcription initiation factor TFIIB
MLVLTMHGRAEQVSREHGAEMEPDDVSSDPEVETTVAANGDPPSEAAVAAVASATKRKRASKKRKAASAKTKSSTARVAQQAKYPRHSVERALRIPRAIYEQNAGKSVYANRGR